MATQGNAIIIHGGGLVDPSKCVLLRIAGNLSRYKVYDKVFIGRYSFESLYTPDYWIKYEPELEKEYEDKRGTIFGTCRGIELTKPDLSNKAISCLKERNISTIITAGGDGSSRQVAEINDVFEENGINNIFPIPLTSDGINGGESIGINEAVKESIRQIENIVSTSLETRDNGIFGVVIVELQGRNRDDIIGNVVMHLCHAGKIADNDIKNILMRVILANTETNEEKLIDEINNSSQKTLILISEGAKIKKHELAKKIKRKVRTLRVGYPSQSNGMTSKDDIEKYYKWTDEACDIIRDDPYKSYGLVKFQDNIWKVPIDYYAKCNPRSNQEARLPELLQYFLKEYVVH